MKAFARRYFVSFPAAIVTLTVMALFSIYGTTVFEGDRSMAFFREWPFTIVLLVFMTQLIVAVLTRWPWKWSHAGWIVTHCGLIGICIGHMLTARGGMEGSLDLMEAQSSNVALQQDRWQLTADLPELGQRVIIPLPLHELEVIPDTPIEKGPFPLPTGDSLVVERYYPTLDVRTRVEPDFTEGAPPHPAYRLNLEARGQSISTWVFAIGDGHDHGPIGFSFGGAPFAALHHYFPSLGEVRRFFDLGRIVVEPGGHVVEVAEAMKQEVPVGDGEGAMHVRVLSRFARYQPQAMAGRGADSYEGAPNPAIRLRLRKGTETRDWTLVALRPDDNLAPADPLGLALRYEVDAEKERRLPSLPQSSIALLGYEGAAEHPDDGPMPVLALTDSEGVIRLASYEPGQRVPLDWLGADVSAAIPEAYRSAREVNEPWVPSYLSNQPALLVRLERDGKAISRGFVRWNRMGQKAELMGSTGGAVKLGYDAREIPLGFTVRLEDFVLDKHEGTENPRSFESFVKVDPLHKAYPVQLPHVVPPLFGGNDGRQHARLKLATLDGLSRGDTLKVGGPRAFYYANVTRIERDAAGPGGTILAENIGRPETLAPGTQIPAGAIAQEVYHIYMNHPLTHGGYTFFQSSYDPQTLKRSIFQVSFDPGWQTVYIGYALTVLGLLLIVYVKPYLVRREARKRAADALAARGGAPAGASPSGSGSTGADGADQPDQAGVADDADAIAYEEVTK